LDEYVPVLTDQELQVIQLVSQGLGNAKIGDNLGISEKRVRNLMSDIYRKMHIDDDGDVHLRVVLINRARELGLLLPINPNVNK
jgi:DNA-binding CsgD family transcriptional regulator